MRLKQGWPRWSPIFAGRGKIPVFRELRHMNSLFGRIHSLFGLHTKFVTPKHPPHFARKLASHGPDRLGRFLFVRDAIRFRSVGGLTQAAAATKKEGVLGSYEKKEEKKKSFAAP